VKRVFVVIMFFVVAAMPIGRATAQDTDDRDRLPATVPADAKEAVVEEVRDGKTLVAVVDGKRILVSLIGVDAPDAKVEPLGECYAGEATDHLAELAPQGATVYLESDMIDRDDEGRRFRFAWIPGEQDEKPVLVNGRMIRDGYAGWLQEEKNVSYESVFERYELEARDRNRGIWKQCGGPHEKIQPTPTPTPTEDEIKAQYRPLADVRELAIRPTGMIGQKISFYGSILDIGVAGPGRVYVLGDENPQEYVAWIQVWVDAPDGSREVISVGFNGDTTGMFNDSYIVVSGTVVDTLSGTNGFGGAITQPLVSAEFVELA
jgi:micrococcal nuclease